MLHHQIAAAIRAGGFAHVAAEAFGLPASALAEQVRRGQAPRARGLSRVFADEIRQAAAQARLRAEMNVFAAEPKLWLTHGPGRDRHDCRGWSVAVQPAAETGLTVNALEDPQFVDTLQALGAELKNDAAMYEQLIRLPTWRALLKAA